MLDYKKYYENMYSTNFYYLKIEWSRALIIKSLLNIKGYCDYMINPLLVFEFMKNGFKDVSTLKKEDKTFTIEADGFLFYETNIDRIKSCGKFFEEKDLSSMVHIINVENGFCVVKINSISKNRDSYTHSDRYYHTINIDFYNYKTFNYLNNIPNKVLGDFVKRSTNGDITWESLTELFYRNNDIISKYIKPDFTRTYYDGKVLPSTEPELTLLLQSCYRDVEHFDKKVDQRRMRK